MLKFWKSKKNKVAEEVTTEAIAVEESQVEVMPVQEVSIVVEPVDLDTEVINTQTIEIEAVETEIVETEVSKAEVIETEVIESQTTTKGNRGWGKQLKDILLGRKTLDEDLEESIETILLSADVGVDTTNKLMSSLTQTSKRKQLAQQEFVFERIQQSMNTMLQQHQKSFVINNTDKPMVILVVGVNGVGKTTSIGKLSHYIKQQGHSVMLAAGDTFRAAAAEQLQQWGQRNQIEVIAQQSGADSAAVIFDGIEAAQARNADVLIADTAGRLHNKDHLMQELSKIQRVMAKAHSSAPHEVLLVLDASTGQNAIHQARQFCQAVTVTGLILTKLDGTAKGGVLFALAEEFNLPVYFVGTGEKVDDWMVFDSQQFIEALFQDN